MDKMQQIKEKLKGIITILEDYHSETLHEDNLINSIDKNTQKALSLIEEMEKEDKFTVKVEIPKPDKNGGCSINCPGYSLMDGHCWNNLQAKKKEYPYCQPGPGCPRFKG